MEQSLSQKVIKNTLWNIIGRFWGAVINLVLTPYIIGHIGIERYGVWAIVGVLTGYFGLLDFGIGTGFVKYIAEYYAKKDYEKINQVVNTGFVFYAIFGLIIISLGFLLIEPVLVLLNIPPDLFSEAKFVFLLGIVIFGVSGALWSVGAIKHGLQRMDISNRVALAISLPQVIGTIYFLEAGYGLPGLMVNNAIILGLSSSVDFIIAHKILPEFRFNYLLCSKEMFKKLFGFGYKVQLTRIPGIIISQTDKILIAYLLAIGLVSFYQIGSTLVTTTMSLVLLLLSALLPAFSEIEARNGRRPLISAYLRVTKYLSFITIPLFTFLIVSASKVIIIWMGPGYEKSITFIRILSIGWMINTISQATALACLAIDKPQAMASGAIITMILNVFLDIILIKIMGFVGVAWGTTIALTVGTTYFLVKAHNLLGVSLRELTKITIPFFLICLIAGGAICGVDQITGQVNLSVSRSLTLLVFMIHGLLFFSIYIMGVSYGKLVTAGDIDFFRQRLPLIRYLSGKSLIRRNYLAE